MALVSLVLVVGCAGERAAPATLVDGSNAHAPDVSLGGVESPVVLVRTRVVFGEELADTPATASCLGAGWSEPPASPAVHRIGTAGESVTFTSRSRRALLACDGAGARSSPRWCGHAHGRFDRGRLRDPRLDLGGCLASDERPVAFAWIVPGRRTRYVVVRRRGFSEAYETAADLPVRIAFTERIDLERSSAAVEVSQHAEDGRRLRAFGVEAVVSG